MTEDVISLRRRLEATKDELERSTIIRQYRQNALDEVFSPSFLDDASLFLARKMDEAIIALAGTALAEETAIIAVGGYGRGRLAPHSDVDLLVLEGTEKGQESVLRLFHAMWDAQIPLSHMTHTPQSALDAAQEDPVTRTSFLDARLLHGDEKVFASFQQRFDSLRRRTIKSFVDQKLEEQQRRLARQSHAFEIEPDIKEGRGGLRDLDTLHWIDRYVGGINTHPGVVVENDDLFTAKERRRIEKIVSFFWNVRVHLHDLSGRPDDRLHFGLQQQIASRLGYHPRTDASAVEAFMRYFFLAAKEVVRLTTSALDTLEQRAGDNMGGAVGAETSATTSDDEPQFVEDFPTIAFHNGHVAFARPDGPASVEEIFSLFFVAARSVRPIEPDSLSSVTRAASIIPPSSEASVEAISIFRRILCESEDLEGTLREMTNAGALGRFLPGFGGAIGKVEYGLFRQFTLDEHILQSAGMFSDIHRDRDDGSFVVTKPLVAALDDVTVPLLALLLREAEHGLIEPTAEELRLRVIDNVSSIVRSKEEADMVAFLVTHRKFLSDTAMRRNVNDLEVIKAAAAEIPTTEHLDYLMIVTSCWRRTAGVRSWQEYSKLSVHALIRNLNAYLTGGAPAFEALRNESREAFRRQTMRELDDRYHPTFSRFIARTDTAFWTQIDVDAAVALAEMVAHAEEQGDAAGVVVRPYKDSFIEIIVYASDRTSLFSDCARVIALNGGSIFSASSTNVDPEGEASDTKAVLNLLIETPVHAYAPLETSLDACEVLKNEILAAINAPAGSDQSMPGPNIGDRREIFDVQPIINFDRHGSSSALILEIEALDRTALLYELSRVFAELGVTIKLAFVSTFGHRAVDTFYLQTADGHKPKDDELIDALRAGVATVAQATG